MSEQQSAAPAAVEQSAQSQEPAAQVESQQAEVQSSAGQEGLSEAQQEQVADAIAEGATPAEVKNMIKEFELVVNGKKVKKKVDLSDEKALIREFQISEANRGGMQKARELEKLYETEIRRLQERPWEVLQELGHDPLKLSEAKLQEWVEEQKKSPEQVEYEKMQKELREAREQLKRQKAEAETLKAQQLQKQAAQEIQAQIDQALSSHKTLPNTQKTVNRIADALIWAMDNGFPDAQVKDVLPMVEQDIRDEMNEFVSNLPEDMMEQYIGQKNIERMRKKRMAQMKATTAAQVPDVTKTAPAQPKDKPKVSMRDFFKNPEKY